MDRRILLTEFLDGLSQRADASFKGHRHQAFVAWYVEAEFGRVEWEFTDGPDDGGIDAVVWLPKEKPSVALIQSKFAERIGKASLSVGAYRDFQNVVECFYSKEGFDTFLPKVRTDVKRHYQKAFDHLQEENNWAIQKKAFRLITTKKRGSRAEFGRIPKENFIYCNEIMDLYRQYRKAATPKARPLRLHIKNKLPYKDGNRTSYLFNARLSDFRNYFDQNDVARIVAGNIRHNLAGRIGEEIRKTFEKKPHDFWYLHNGLTIVCDDFTEDRSQNVTLVNPSVVNGAQTLYAISTSPKKRSPALVPARVIVRNESANAEDDKWLQTVIRGVNTQNHVKRYDFRSNEPGQVELQKKFHEMKVFYERKRGEWRDHKTNPKFKNFDRIRVDKLGQILTATRAYDGQGVLLVKRSTEQIFEEKNYRQVFPSGPRETSRRFRKIYLAYRLHRFLYNFGYEDATERRQQQHAFWNTLWLLHLGFASGLHSRITAEAIQNVFDSFEGKDRWGESAQRVIRRARRRVWSAWKKEARRWTPNNFFKSPIGNEKLLSNAFPKMQPELQKLGRHVAEGRRPAS